MNPTQNSDLSKGIADNDHLDQVFIHVKTRRATHVIVCGLSASKLDKPQGTIAIMQGTKVVTSDGKPIGSVERMLARPDANGPRDYLIAESLLLKEKQLIPVEWIDSFGEDEVRLAAGARAGMSAPAS